MSDTLLASVYSLGTSFCTASFSLIVRRGQQHGSALTGVVIGLIVSVPFLLAATWLAWDPALWSAAGVLWFALGGLTGPSLGRVFMYRGIHHLGVARAMPMMATGPLFTGALAIAFMGERPGPLVWAGTVLITAGCAAISYKKKQDKSWSRRHLWMPVVSLMGFAVSNIFRKLGLAASPSPLLGITVTSVVGLAFLLMLARFLSPAQRPDLRPGKAWAFYGACGLINTLSFFLHFFALLYGDLTIVTPLSSISPLFALLFSWILLRDVERVTGWIVGGTVLIVLGVALIAWRIV